MDCKNLTGQKFGRWTVIAPAHKRHRQQYCTCRCECGTIRDVELTQLKNGSSQSCGCSRNKSKGLVGKRYNHLTVIDTFAYKHRTFCICRCDCGNLTTVRADALKSGGTKGCGCLIADAHKKHGRTNHRLHHVWVGMIQRCCNSKNPAYRLYGGRGIGICEEWRSNFSSFFDWAMQNGYADDLSIDRIDVDGDYCPSNCRFANAKEQGRNRRSTKMINFNGETKPLTEWCELLGLSEVSVRYRLSHGWSPEKAFTTPIRKLNKRNQ